VTFEDRVRRELHELGESLNPPPMLRTLVDQRLDGVEPARRIRRRSIAVLAAAATVVALVAAGAVVGRGGTDEFVASGGERPGTAAQRRGWVELPDGPLSARTHAVGVWTGGELFVWGGRRGPDGGVATDGARNDPTSGRWKRVAAAPIAGRYLASAVWTGREVVVWGGVARRGRGVLGDGAAYDPATNRWRRLPSAPLAPRAGQAMVWTGRQVIVWGGASAAGGGDAVFADGAAYDPAANQWSPLPPSGLAARANAAAVWDGRDVIVWGGEDPTGRPPTPRADGAMFDPAGAAWRPMRAIPPEPRASASAVWSGRELIVWGGSTGNGTLASGAAYDPAADRWRAIAASPLSARSEAAAGWDGGQMLVWGGFSANVHADGAAYDPDRDRWRRLPTAGDLHGRVGHVAAWTGATLLIWGGDAGPTFGDGAAYRP
jgi:N-acetylneuraminic acid mutarotase